VNPRDFLTEFLPTVLAQNPETVLPAPEPESVPVPEPEPLPVEVPDPFAWRRDLLAQLNALLDMEADRVSALRRMTAALVTESPPEDAEIAAFRAAAETSEGASVAFLTPTVQAWLRATDQLEKYRVRP
jgi:hypothetical protein